MPVKDYELNLSATEFLYFQECPQKFRLYRLLNPVPFKAEFESSKRTITSYELRNYSKGMDPIRYHAFFENFHWDYRKLIADDIPPPEIQQDKIKLLYWLNQQKKYFNVKDDCFWYPLETEVKLMTENQRGIIDCLMLKENTSGLYLIDFKPIPTPNDHLQLLFYANLVNNYRLENGDDERFDFDVMEIGCYYYELGIEKTYELSEKTITCFNNLLNQSRRKIKEIALFFDNSSCWNCDLIRLCKIEKKRR